MVTAEDFINSKEKKSKIIDTYKLAEKVRKNYDAERRYNLNKAQIAYEEKKRNYAKTFGGKSARVITRGIGLLRKGAFTRSLYGNQISPMPLQMGGVAHNRTFGRRVGYARAGRPVGTVKHIDPNTGQPVGIYEWRKILNARLRQQRQEYLRQRAISPQQQQMLNQMEQRRNAVAQDPERQIIPSTTGKTPMQSYFDEIDSYANLF